MGSFRVPIEKIRHKSDLKYKKYLGRECKGKKRYSSEHDVRQTIKTCQKYRDVQLDFYYCENCLGYHITSRMEFRVEGERL